MIKLKAVLLVGCALLRALAVRAQTSGVNNGKLNGNYAFDLNGFNVDAAGPSAFAAVGRFHADGAGNVTNSEPDSNGIAPASVLTAQPFSGTYAIGADNRGVKTLNFQEFSTSEFIAIPMNDSNPAVWIFQQ